MVLFSVGKKETKIGKGEIPTEKVKNFLNKGFSEIEIIDLLRKEGYSPEEISKAFLQVSSETKITSPQASEQTSGTTQQIQKTLDEERKENENIRVQSVQQTFKENVVKEPVQTQQHQTRPFRVEEIRSLEKIPEKQQNVDIDYVTLEEYIQYLIREKIQEINKRLMETSLKFKDFENKFANLKEELEKVSRGNKEDVNRILGEIRTMRDSITELSIKVEALSKTLKELLPSLVESVRLLSEIVQKLKT